MGAPYPQFLLILALAACAGASAPASPAFGGDVFETAQQSGGEPPAAAEPPASANEEDGATNKNSGDENVAKPPLAAEAAENPPEILRDLARLPFAARKMHELLVEAARAGDIEALRSFLGTGDDVTMLSLGGVEGDPVEFLKSQSGDSDGHEILAILLEVLESGFVHIDAGTENELFVWPYFFAVPVEKLTPPQKVELFTLLTSGDYEEMKSFGAYVFYRAGITPQGRWRFFVAGD